jgi:hypothetical protein
MSLFSFIEENMSRSTEYEQKKHASIHSRLLLTVSLSGRSISDEQKLSEKARTDLGPMTEVRFF